jgi:hypothetical protein
LSRSAISRFGVPYLADRTGNFIFAMSSSEIDIADTTLVARFKATGLLRKPRCAHQVNPDGIAPL